MLTSRPDGVSGSWWGSTNRPVSDSWAIKQRIILLVVRGHLLGTGGKFPVLHDELHRVIFTLVIYFFFLIQGITNLKKLPAESCSTCKWCTSFHAVVWDSLNDSGLSNETRALSSYVTRKTQYIPINWIRLHKSTVVNTVKFVILVKHCNPDLKCWYYFLKLIPEL